MNRADCRFEPVFGAPRAQAGGAEVIEVTPPETSDPHIQPSMLRAACQIRAQPLVLVQTVASATCETSASCSRSISSISEHRRFAPSNSSCCRCSDSGVALDASLSFIIRS